MRQMVALNGAVPRALPLRGIIPRPLTLILIENTELAPTEKPTKINYGYKNERTLGVTQVKANKK